MYMLDQKFSDMYNLQNQRFKGKRIKEYIKSVEVNPYGTDGRRMIIKTVTTDGRHINIFTSGTMTLAQIINKLVNEYQKPEAR